MSDDTVDKVPGRTTAGHTGSGKAVSEPDQSTSGDGPGPATGTGTGVNRLTYERALAELEDVVRRLEAGGTSLEEALALWERGEDLARTCQDFLDGARARLEARRTQQQHPAG